MNTDTIREISEQIVNEQFVGNWRTYVLLAALALVSAVVSTFMGSYYAKRAELFASKADLDEVLRQLRVTTEATEQVRVAVSHADWVAREWRSTRKAKLEELLTAAYSTDQWLEEQQNKWLYDKVVEPSHDPIDRVNVIGALYFPELRSELAQFTVAHHDLVQYILDTARIATGFKAQALREFAEQWKPLYRTVRVALAALETKASNLMQEVAGA